METKTLKTERTDLAHVDHRNITIEENFNARSENNYGDIEGLARNIVANGVIDALIGFKVRGEDRFIMTEGHRRLRAVKLAFKFHSEGKSGFEDISKIERIPFRSASSNTKERLLIMATTGFGKVPLTDLEKASLYKRLIDFDMESGLKRGEAIKGLVKSLGISQATVYNILQLNDLDDDIKAFVESGQISGSTVVTIIREEKDVEKQKELVLSAIYDAEDKTKATGSKVKATASNVKGLKEKATLREKSPLLRLKEIAVELEKIKVNNVRTRVLLELIDGIEAKTPLSKMIDAFIE